MNEPVTTTDPAIVIEKQSYAELLKFEHSRTETLRLVAAVLNQPLGYDKAAAVCSEIAERVSLMVLASEGVHAELLRIAREQGVRFEPTPSVIDQH